MNYDILKRALIIIVEACEDLGIAYRQSNEESDLQSIFVDTKEPDMIDELESRLYKEYDYDTVVFESRRVRGGTIISLSLGSINELQWEKIQETYKRSGNVIDFRETAKRLMEAQYKSATRGASRSNQTGRMRNMLTTDYTYSGKPLAKRINKRLAVENIGGIATPSGLQPSELVARFRQALEKLGTQLGLGSIPNMLKERGIHSKMSDDGLSIILYIINGSTGAAQPLMLIPTEELAESHKMETYVRSVLAFAKNEAPGEQEQKEAQLRAQEKAIRDVVSSFVPKEKESPEEQAATQAVEVKAN